MSPRTARIAELNDQLRETFLTGRVVVTRGIAELPEEARSDIISKVRSFSSFTEDNDPHGEHDFGSIDVENVGKVFWKIDYYDPDYQYLSDDPADPKVTRRVLTIMLAEEY